MGFCLTSQISISCEAPFLKKAKIVIENKLSKNKEFFLVELAKNEYEKKKDYSVKNILSRMKACFSYGLMRIIEIFG